MIKNNVEKTEHFAPLDYLRVVCVIYIVGLWHMVSYTDIEGFKHIQSYPFLQQSTYCVLSAFTFLSGFLAFREFKGAKDVLKYYLKRLIRLWPLFALAEIAMVLLGINEGKMLPWVLAGLGWAKEPFPLTLWFVGMIFLFYLLNPVISSKKLYLGISAAVLVEVAFILLNFFLRTDERLWFYWPFFVTGSIVRRIPWKEWSGKLKETKITLIKAVAAVLCIAGFVPVLVFAEDSDFSYKTYLSAILFIAGGIMLFGLIKVKLLNTIIAQIAYASMCAYLYHRVFFTILCKVLGKKISLLPVWILFLILFFGVSYLLQFGYDKAVGVISGAVSGAVEKNKKKKTKKRKKH